jgi:hypothetical protein
MKTTPCLYTSRHTPLLFEEEKEGKCLLKYLFYMRAVGVDNDIGIYFGQAVG